MPKKDRVVVDGVKKHGIVGPKSPTGVAMDKSGKSGTLEGGDGSGISTGDSCASKKPTDRREGIDGGEGGLIDPDFD